MMNAKRIFALAVLAALLLTACSLIPVSAAAQEETIVLRICNWEEYIDLGDWDPEKDRIDLEELGEDEEPDLENWDENEIIDGDKRIVFGKNPMIEVFEEWYYRTYGKKVRVEYSTFGTNEDLYNMLTIGDVYDLVCPSDYMIMKLMAEDKLVPLSGEFKDSENKNNYYERGLSPYIRDIFDSHEIGGRPWSDYAAGYMWGITGFIYNPEYVAEEDASTWRLLDNTAYNRKITLKDNVRDAYFAAVGAVKSELLTSDEFRGRKDYTEALQDEMNEVSPETVSKTQNYLQKVRENVYSFETDSGKADMITGKIVANYQWSGDAVYAMDQAQGDDDTPEEERVYLNFAVPEECTNIYFDGWVMLKAGIGQDAEKQHAAEAFINFISRPDNVIRNMYYIGYTSTISGGEDGRILAYLDWNYGAEEEETEETGDTGEAEENGETREAEAEETETEEAEAEEVTGEAEETEETGEADAEGAEAEEAAGEDAEAEEPTVEYDLSYFFLGMGKHSEDYVLTVPESQLKRQLSAQYPSEDVIRRASIMIYFNDEQNEMINRMWIRVRCFNINSVPVWVWIALGVLIIGGVLFGLRRRAVRNRQYE